MSRATLSKEPGDVARMFDGVARRYDVTNTVLSPTNADDTTTKTVTVKKTTIPTPPPPAKKPAPAPKTPFRSTGPTLRKLGV